MFNVSMEEAREGAVFPGVVLSVLKILGKCLRLRANPAHISGHLLIRIKQVTPAQTTHLRGLCAVQLQR